MTRDDNSPSTKQMAADIVVAFLANQTVDAAKLPDLVRAVRAALADDEIGLVSLSEAPASSRLEEQAQPAPQGVDAALAGPGPDRKPAVPIDESVTADYLISLEDGGRYRSLKRHLMAKYNLTPEQYRARWGLPADYPMVAPSYASERAAVAKRIGLGRTKAAPPASPRPRRA